MIDVLVGGQLDSSVYMRRYAFDGSTIKWGYSPGGTVNGIAIARDGRIALAHAYYTSYQVTVLSADGVKLWSYSHSSTSGQDGIAVCFDSSGNLIIGCEYHTSSPYYTLRKLDTTGSLLWSAAPNGNTTRCVCVDSNDNVIAGGDNGYIRKYSPTGTLLYSYNHGAAVYGVAVDSSDNVLMTGTRYSFSVTTRKLDPTLTTVAWSADHGNGCYGIAVDKDDNVITVGIVSSSVTTRKYQSDGTPVWTKNHGATVRAVACDLAGNIYTAGDAYSSLEVHRYDAAGNNTALINFGTNLYAISTKTETIPPLAISIGFRSPLPLREISASSLITGIIIYRCYLTGGSGTIQIPMSSFQCRRRIDTKAWLSIVCPSATDALVTQITDRSDGQIVLKRGVKYPDGSEQLDEMMRVDYETLRFDKGSNSASATLTGRSTETYIAKERTVTGVSYRATTDNSRRVRCDIDTYLSPGDTVDLGGEETMTVSEVTIYCSPSQAGMELGET
jgi:hypothetical protein